MNKKGFSLIELLAVITILAVIAIITTPVIFGVIENSKMNAFTSSVEEMKNVVVMDYNEYARGARLHIIIAIMIWCVLSVMQELTWNLILLVI